MTEILVCPRCSNPSVELHALSRLDHQTLVCTSCGQDEGLFAHMLPETPLPPFGELADYWSHK